ncbi:MAG: undecaprenyldiphospho-muramoylpentapeptide beta-N-acetylglucosaminyltransferase [Bacteroidia bacterium]|jgi:UDP-N-acetylglucosamine--N-acetylmuramyl-(pentapeptide) pyrophosphoryl-undecaprenol N-acetylglucosamine transferase|nr:undecaprenyldiphospho-muramoylpentapeptide beta-N-acetylglucosaminyltransferase [Bacteroidia bacterium]
MPRKYRVLISGGGTGGHIFPAIAIAHEIKAKYPGSEIEFVGANGKMEMEKVPAAGYKIHGLWISGLQRRLTPKNLSLPFKVLSSLWNSRKIIKKFKPDFTVGVGGYASGPLNYMASKMGVPVYLQEQNSFPGITNKLLKGASKKICVAYEGMDRFFPKQKIVMTGNPIRQDILASKDTRTEGLAYFSLENQKKTVLIVGGSLGARTVNEAIEANLVAIKKAGIQLLWQTGENYNGAFGSFSWGTRTAFVKRMDLAYKVADVVISRAGAMSVSELSALGKATIFVPSPFVSEDHQTKNAMSLVNKNAALLCRDAEATQKLGDMLISLIQNDEQIAALQSEIIKLGLPQAAESIVREIVQDLGR